MTIYKHSVYKCEMSIILNFSFLVCSVLEMYTKLALHVTKPFKRDNILKLY